MTNKDAGQPGTTMNTVAPMTIRTGRRINSADSVDHVGRVQQLTGLTGLSIGPVYVRPVSCWTAFIAIQ